MSLATVLDSWWEPDAAHIARAQQLGYVGWAGYFSNGHDRIYHGWADATFQRIKAAGLHTVAYCSGLADPGWIQARADQLGITAVLDVESSIWVGTTAQIDAWLAKAPRVALYASEGAGIIQAHRTHGHAGYVVAAYPGGADPGRYWPAGFALPNPARPYAWQYTDTLSVLGGNCDGAHFHPSWFATAPEEDMTAEEHAWLQAVHSALPQIADVHNALPELTQLQAQLASLQASTSAGLTATQQAQLADVQDRVDWFYRQVVPVTGHGISWPADWPWLWGGTRP